MNAPIEKVTAFLTRGKPPARELLVFAHPSAGIQVPAGTVEPGERPEAAVLRELLEESGLAAVRIHADLGSQTSDLPAGQGIAGGTTPLYDSPALDAPTAALVLQRGWPLDSVGPPKDGWARVAYAEHDLTVTPPRLLERYEGWIPVGFIGTRLLRHFFHLMPSAPTPERWEHLAEGRHTFSFFWTPLVPRPRLVAGQEAWLDAVYGQLAQQA